MNPLLQFYAAASSTYEAGPNTYPPSLVTVGSGTTRVLPYQIGAGPTFTYFAAASDAPSACTSASFRPNGLHLTVGHATAPYITTFKRSAIALTPVSAPTGATLAGTANSVCWTPDGTRLLVAGGSALTGLYYTFTGDAGVGTTFSLMAGGGGQNVVACSADSVSVFIGGAMAERGRFANWDGSAYIRQTQANRFSPTLASGSWPSITSASWHPSGSYLALGAGTGGVRIYQRVGAFDTSGEFTQVANFTPSGNTLALSYNHDGTRLAVGHSSSPHLSIYSVSGSTYTKLTDPANIPPNDVNAITWNTTDTLIAVAHATTPFVTIYTRSGDTLTKVTDPATISTAENMGIAFSPNA